MIKSLAKLRQFAKGNVEDYLRGEMRQNLLAIEKAFDSGGIPTGSLMAYMGMAAPSGWLVCDGSEVPISSYQILYNLIGDMNGKPSKTGYFKLPDTRGLFLRGIDNGAGRDGDAATRTALNTGGNTGDSLHSYQDQSVGPHTHDIHTEHIFLNTTLAQYISHGAAQTGVGAYPLDLPTLNTGTGIGSDTRPKNIYVNYIIKT